ncbi:hypothetical protein FACS1894125_4770 [Actinomycetota bacterium]|nr:hypothetical protein FACS1894125_4770 [Actinomycetota bacterium]
MENKAKALGIGGCGCNFINFATNEGLADFEKIAVISDESQLSSTDADVRFILGKNSTSGLGAAGDPNLGEKIAKEDISEIQQLLDGASSIVLVAGLGGGVGSGATPVIAEVAKSMGIQTAAIVTMPFSFEGEDKKSIAQESLQKIKEQIESVTVLKNDDLMSSADANVTLKQAYKQGYRTILESLTR